jgi:hypothetical protein
MKFNDAVRLLRQHSGELESQQDTLLGNLRPYRELNHKHFSEIVKALYCVASRLNSPSPDRDLVFTLWSLTRTARNCTAVPFDPILQQRHFISVTDKKTLDRWIDVVETMTLYLLRGFEDWESICGLPDEVNCYDSLVDTAWLVPPFMKLLEYHLAMENEGGSGDDEEILCFALTKIGQPAQSAITLLKHVASTTKYDRVKRAAEMSIITLQNCCHSR